MVAVVIPAYDPPTTLVDLVTTLVADTRVVRAVVVDDGSGEAARTITAALEALPRVTVLRHPINRGKGDALKTAFAHILGQIPGATTVVTADADGQHLPDDILRVAGVSASVPDALVIGVRDVGDQAPARSRIGNRITRSLFHRLVGQRLRDTQSGLRAFARRRLDALVALEGSGYEYELNMLIWCRQASVPIVEEPIATVYLDGNRLSHFRPVRDSWRIYSILLRFGAVSSASAVIDNLVFAAGIAAGVGSTPAVLAARAVSASVNYPLVRGWVFPQPGRRVRSLGPYLLLLGANVLAAQALMALVDAWTELSLFSAKILCESLFFLPNFLLQRDIVFRSAEPTTSGATDWTAYYASVPFTARLTRKYTGRVLVQTLQQASHRCGPVRAIAELGGANSCFLDNVCAAIRPDSYTIVDANAFGLSRLSGWQPPPGASTRLSVRHGDVRSIRLDDPLDTVFSVGLIEHFDPQGTRDVLDRHFTMVRKGGAVIVSYPTPTWLYRMTRRLLEALRLWRFPDERPVRFAEVASAAAPLGEVVSRRTLWPLLLTQEMVLFQKR